MSTFIFQMLLLIIIGGAFVLLLRKLVRNARNTKSAQHTLSGGGSEAENLAPVNNPGRFTSIGYANKSIRQVAYVFIIVNVITLFAYFLIKDKFEVEMWTIYASAATLVISSLLLIPMPNKNKLILALLLTISAVGNFIVRLPMVMDAKGLLIFYAIIIPFFFIAMACRALFATWYIHKQEKLL